MNDKELTRRIIAGDIARDRTGSKLTPQAQERATDFAMQQVGRGLNFGQLCDIGISHATSDVLKEKP